MKILYKILLIFTFTFITADALAYDRSAVATYADLYWGWKTSNQDRSFDNGQYGEGYNISDSPNYNSNDYYEYFSNDCANFVSQCLIAGGLSLSAGPGLYGRRWINPSIKINDI